MVCSLFDIHTIRLYSQEGHGDCRGVVSFGGRSMATPAKAPPKGQKIAFPHRGDIYLVSFDPTAGAEIQKTRPASVIQNDIGNQYSPITIVAAITSKFDPPPYPTEVLVAPKDSGLSQRSAVALNQIRSVDRQRLIKRIGKASAEVMGRVDRAIAISLGLVET
jgi:mRNA interferase MazF